MPFKSEAQRKFMWAKHPRIAARWAHKYGSKPEDEHKKKKREAVKKRLAEMARKK